MKIELKNIYKQFERPDSDTPLEIITDISLSVDSSDTIAITGPSGSGKSTLLNIMGTLDRPSSGQVLIDGVDVTSLNDVQLADFRNRKIGFVFQLHHLLPQLNLLDNVLVPTIPINDKRYRNEAVDRAKELLNIVGLADRMKQFPGQLSGGECQRAAVVRALINEPSILLADEPTGSLDSESANSLSEFLCKVNRDFNVALVTVTHSAELANRMGRIYSLKHGRLHN